MSRCQPSAVNLSSRRASFQVTPFPSSKTLYTSSTLFLGSQRKPRPCQVAVSFPRGGLGVWDPSLRGEGFDVLPLLSNLLTSVFTPWGCAEQGFFVDSEITFESDSGKGDSKPSGIRSWNCVQGPPLGWVV